MKVSITFNGDAKIKLEPETKEEELLLQLAVSKPKTEALFESNTKDLSCVIIRNFRD